MKKLLFALPLLMATTFSTACTLDREILKQAATYAHAVGVDSIQATGFAVNVAIRENMDIDTILVTYITAVVSYEYKHSTSEDPETIALVLSDLQNQCAVEHALQGK